MDTITAPRLPLSTLLPVAARLPRRLPENPSPSLGGVERPGQLSKSLNTLDCFPIFKMRASIHEVILKTHETIYAIKDAVSYQGYLFVCSVTLLIVCRSHLALKDAQICNPI